MEFGSTDKMLRLLFPETYNQVLVKAPAIKSAKPVSSNANKVSAAGKEQRLTLLNLLITIDSVRSSDWHDPSYQYAGVRVRDLERKL
jgi:hypothetical protein